MGQLRELLVSYDMSLLSTPAAATTVTRNQVQEKKDRKETDLILESFLEPILDNCVKNSSELRTPLESAIYLVNCYHLVQVGGIHYLNVLMMICRLYCLPFQGIQTSGLIKYKI